MTINVIMFEYNNFMVSNDYEWCNASNCQSALLPHWACSMTTSKLFGEASHFKSFHEKCWKEIMGEKSQKARASSSRSSSKILLSKIRFASQRLSLQRSLKIYWNLHILRLTDELIGLSRQRNSSWKCWFISLTVLSIKDFVDFLVECQQQFVEKWPS